MRTIKRTIPAGIVALLFVFAASATAESTALCKAHKEPCPKDDQYKEFHLNSVGLVKFLNDVADILCLGSLIRGDIGDLGNPQGIQTTAYTFTGCGTNATHTNCTVTLPVRPNFFVLKTKLNLGEITETSSQLKFTCTGVFGTCTYKYPERTYTLEGAQHNIGTGNGMLTYPSGEEEGAKEGELELEEGELACPTLGAFDGLYEPLEKLYIVS
ncbi:MAG TPA: hypothetical protein VFW48_02065 [Solirubrobacterales bacterium]|nr:hypothetical protein [Solirubrobacterales bacterium]